MNQSVHRPRFVLASHYPLVILTLAQFFYYADRYVLNILIEPIRNDLGLTDGQMGLVAGLAFGIAYSCFLIPIGLLTDRINRVRLLSAGVVIWCSFTALTGTARSFAHLVGLRIGVAGGEASGFVTIQSLVADFYRPENRSKAYGFLLSGGVCGILVSYAIAGALNDWIGWRATFAVIGSAGLFVVLLLFFTVKEPLRGQSDGRAIDVANKISIGVSLRELFSRPAFLFLLIGFSVAAIGVYANLTWLPTFFIRRFDLSVSQAGYLSSSITILPMVIGMLAGGFVGDKLYQRDRSWAIRLPGLLLFVSFPLLLLQYFSPTLVWAMIVGVIPAFVSGFYTPPLQSAIQALAGARLRGTANALTALGMLLVGQGVGPSLVGLLSDLFGAGAERAPYLPLQYGMSIVAIAYVVGGSILWIGGSRFAESLQAANRFDQQPQSLAVE